MKLDVIKGLVDVEWSDGEEDELHFAADRVLLHCNVQSPKRVDNPMKPMEEKRSPPKVTPTLDWDREFFMVSKV